MNTKELLAKLLGLSPHWSIEKIEICDERRKVYVHVMFDPSVVLHCPVCGVDNVFTWDRGEKICQYFSFFDFHTYIVAHPLWVSCPQHGIQKIKAPWEDKIDDYLAFNKTI